MKADLKVYNPSNGELIKEVKTTPIEDIKEIVNNSKEAQKKWQMLTIDQRINQLQAATKELAPLQRELGALLSQEMGKSLQSGIGEVAGCITDVKSKGVAIKNALADIEVEAYGMKTTTKYEPLGVCAVIAPWNYPIAMAHWMIVPALIAGNSVILKPSEETPLIAIEYVKALNNQLPKDLLQIVLGDKEQGEALVKEDIDLVTFTGSRETGKKIMATAAAGMKRLIMELGGKDPLIVMDDADIEQAAMFAVGNSFSNAGQMCVSTERIIADEKIAEKLQEKILTYVARYKVGAYNDPMANLGPIINEKQRQKIILQISDAIDKGAKLLTPDLNHPKGYILPTVLTNITQDMIIDQEETFGPVICIATYKNIEEAIKRANNTKFGLGAVIFGKKDVSKHAAKLEAGMIGVNQGTGGIGDAPWVGAKESGYGYHGSPDGHRQFTQVKIISEQI